jgi:hypothetical protein
VAGFLTENISLGEQHQVKDSGDIQPLNKRSGKPDALGWLKGKLADAGLMK